MFWNLLFVFVIFYSLFSFFIWQYKYEGCSLFVSISRTFLFAGSIILLMYCLTFKWVF